MRRSESFVLCTILILSVAGIVFSFLKPRAKTPPLVLEQPMSVAMSGLLPDRKAFQGDQSAPFTLIEFGDYECSPCRASRPAVNQLMLKYKGRLKLDFRNLPLPQIHSNAMYSAIVAEAAREQGSFWIVHNKLFDAALSDSTIASIAQQNLSPTALSDTHMLRARHRVVGDMELASKLGLEGTPSFILATPEGKLYHLNSIDSVSNFLK